MHYVPTFRPVDARSLAAMLTEAGVDLPAALGKALALGDAADAARTRPHRRALDLTAGELIEHAALLAAYDATSGDVSPMHQALVEIADQGAREAAADLRAGGIDTVIEQLRPEFDAAAAIVREAAALGIRSDTSPQWVMDAGPKAIAAWQRLHPAIARLNQVAILRVRLSELLNLAPTLTDAQQMSGLSLDVGTVDYSVCFTDPDSGAFTVDGRSHRNRTPGASMDWLLLAASAPLRLNTPAEVKAAYRRRSAIERGVPLDEQPSAVLGRDRHKPSRDDQTAYAG